ncbi:hypothetical protein VE25_06170 [Devosia geojensis]|uniref:Solute-binding protein family 3/N-terminal domain-containing protein n=1 Tax=Devosia geojensis TaxID=443610 RepID=A0A0F5FUJ4_9HYPH|nr:transporter substrate-binding domain-containing protein [Devosia geojensis]KKB12519.1 hypothetical protein VE25_06170 [Devosia geojensis]
MSGKARHRWLRSAANIALIGGLLFALSFLPPDNSLADVQRTGVLKLCVPESYPPLVATDPQMPGFDVELARMIAEEIGVRLAVNVMSSIGRDFNPRNWRLTRGQCNVIAGGVADTVQTRGFLQTLPTLAETGWVAVSADGALPVRGSAWAVWPGTSGLDRLALSGWLRETGVTARLARSPAELQELLESGQVQGAIMERFASTAIDFEDNSYRIFWLPPDRFARFRMAFGLWKGDQTLYRAVRAALDKLERSDAVYFIGSRYGLEQQIGSTSE